MNLTRQVEKNQGKFKTQKRLLQGSGVRGLGGSLMMDTGDSTCCNEHLV